MIGIPTLNASLFSSTTSIPRVSFRLPSWIYTIALMFWTLPAKKQREKKKNSLVDIQYALTLDIFQIKFTHSSDALALPTHTHTCSHKKKTRSSPGECEMLIMENVPSDEPTSLPKSPKSSNVSQRSLTSQEGWGGAEVVNHLPRQAAEKYRCHLWGPWVGFTSPLDLGREKGPTVTAQVGTNCSPAGKTAKAWARTRTINFISLQNFCWSNAAKCRNVLCPMNVSLLEANKPNMRLRTSAMLLLLRLSRQGPHNCTQGIKL